MSKHKAEKGKNAKSRILDKDNLQESSDGDVAVTEYSGSDPIVQDKFPPQPRSRFDYEEDDCYEQKRHGNILSGNAFFAVSNNASLMSGKGKDSASIPLEREKPKATPSLLAAIKTF